MAIGQGSGKFNDILELFGSAEEFYKASKKELAQARIFNSSSIEKIKSVSLDSAKKAAESAQRDGQRILCYDDEKYPSLFRNIFCPPAVLYIKGNLPDMDNEVGVTIVGSRKCSSYGYEAAQLLSYRLAMAGAVIVSGGALGIDTAAHRGCLDAGGATVAVLPCGIDVHYNMTNAELRKEITSSGALVSEYPAGTPVWRYSFHARNRLLAALSRGTVVIEAGEKSGALITANHAAEQGKDIFALPGNLKSPYSVGTNRLIKDGAYSVECPLDVLEQYAPFYPHKLNLDGADQPLFAGTAIAPQPKKQKPTPKPQRVPSQKQEEKIERKLPDGLSDDARLVAESLRQLPLNTDDITLATGIATGRILRALTELELFDVVESLPGSRYILKR